MIGWLWEAVVTVVVGGTQACRQAGRTGPSPPPPRPFSRASTTASGVQPPDLAISWTPTGEARGTTPPSSGEPPQPALRPPISPVFPYSPAELVPGKTAACSPHRFKLAGQRLHRPRGFSNYRPVPLGAHNQPQPRGTCKNEHSPTCR